MSSVSSRAYLLNQQLFELRQRCCCLLQLRNQLLLPPPLLIALLPQPRQLALQAPQPQPTSQRRRRHTHISRYECQRLPLHQTALNGLLTLGTVTARKDDAPAADQAAITNVVGMMLFSGGG